MTNRAYKEWLESQRDSTKWWETALVVLAILALLGAMLCG